MTEAEYISRLIFDPNAMKAIRLKTNQNGGDAEDRERAILFVTRFLTLVNNRYKKGVLNTSGNIISTTATSDNTYFVIPGFENTVLNQPIIVFNEGLEMWVLRVYNNLSINVNIKTIQS